jgi:hypothetical protein
VEALGIHKPSDPGVEDGDRLVTGQPGDAGRLQAGDDLGCQRALLDLGGANERPQLQEVVNLGPEQRGDDLAGVVAVAALLVAEFG